MGKHKEEIKAPLQLLLPEAVYDYFESVHAELSDQNVHLFFLTSSIYHRRRINPKEGLCRVQ